MGLNETLENIDLRLAALQADGSGGKKKKKFGFSVKLPRNVVRKAKQDGWFAVLLLKSDSQGEFTNGFYSDGLVVVGDKQFSYDKASVFWVNKNKVPLMVYYEWRLTPVGSSTDALKNGLSNDSLPFAPDGDCLVKGSGVVDSRSDHSFAEEVGLTNYGQRTIIRSLEQALLPVDKKGFKGMSPILWLLLIVGVIYGISQVFGGG